MKYPDNDMDDLFNKAGQDYPLRTDGKNWDAVKEAIVAEHSPATGSITTGKYFRYLPLLLLLLIPAVFFVVDNVDRMDTKAKPNLSTSNKEKVNEDVDIARGDERINAKTDIKDEQNLNDNLQQENLESTKEQATQRNGDNTRNTIQGNNRAIKENFKSYGEQRRRSDIDFHPELDIKENLSLEKNTLSATIDPSSPDALLPASFGSVEMPSSIINPASMKTFAHQNISDPSKIKKGKTGSFYYGIKAGPDLSNIKGQRINKIGYAAGILLGYQFNKRWSIEVSALWSSKKYYTDGKYFDKSRANIPWSVELYYLDGGCNMIEVPIAIRHRFSSKPNSFFATAGLNSYFMNKENYSYLADGGTGRYEGHREYKKSGNYFLSNVQLSAGYELKAFNKTNVRIEPYLQLPVKEIGIGKMPITSAGVHFGLIRQLR